MKRSRFSVAQIVAVLKQVELRMAVPEVVCKVGISEQTFYWWKKQYGSLQPDPAHELKQLQEENTWLKKLVDDLSQIEEASSKLYSNEAISGFLSEIGIDKETQVQNLSTEN